MAVVAAVAMMGMLPMVVVALMALLVVVVAASWLLPVVASGRDSNARVAATPRCSLPAELIVHAIFLLFQRI